MRCAEGQDVCTTAQWLRRSSTAHPALAAALMNAASAYPSFARRFGYYADAVAAIEARRESKVQRRQAQRAQQRALRLGGQDLDLAEDG